jgi:hypothetical protein
MNFEKLKELINSIPEEQLDYEVELNFIYNTKAGQGIKTGAIEGVLFIDNMPLKLVGKEIQDNW